MFLFISAESLDGFNDTRVYNIIYIRKSVQT